MSNKLSFIVIVITLSKTPIIYYDDDYQHLLKFDETNM